MRQKVIVLAIFITLAGLIGYYFGYDVGFEQGANESDSGNGGEVVIDFFSCVAAGNPVMESYPRQCRSKGGELFVENIGNELEKQDLIRIGAPRPNQEIMSSLNIIGEARGFWFFEASFPIILTDWNGNIIAEHFVTATDEWMTEDFVTFAGSLEFESPYKAGDPDFMQRGTLILQRHNASGLPEHDDALEIPVRFQ